MTPELAALNKWLRDAPGGEFLPEDVLDRDIASTGVCIDSRDRLFIKLFDAAYTPTGEHGACCEFPLYSVPKIVAHTLEWYAEEGDWSVCP